MALTCSVLGHAYGEPTVERDREERGSEVVVTVREYETCHRCGTARVVSENKEVTAVEAGGDDGEPIVDRATDLDAPPAEPTPADSTPDAADASTVADETSASVGDDASGEVADEGAEILDAEEGAPVASDVVDEELASPSVPDEPADPPESDVEDDGVVLTDPDDDGRAPGEWPEEDEPASDDRWSPPSDLTNPAPSEPEPASGSTITVPDGEFQCEECGYSTPVESSSLRAGDFCPACRRGALTHVPDAE